MSSVDLITIQPEGKLPVGFLSKDDDSLIAEMAQAVFDITLRCPRGKVTLEWPANGQLRELFPVAALRGRWDLLPLAGRAQLSAELLFVERLTVQSCWQVAPH